MDGSNTKERVVNGEEWVQGERDCGPRHPFREGGLDVRVIRGGKHVRAGIIMRKTAEDKRSQRGKIQS